MSDNEIMKNWDRWRKYIANGGKASWPRDEFESLVDELCELRAFVREIQTENLDSWQIVNKANKLTT